MNESIFLIIQEMTAVLSIEQLHALQKSLIKNLVDEKPKTEQILSNEEYINRYITAKGLEGKTKGTLYNYRNTFNRILKYCDVPIPSITTDMLRYAIEQLQNETDCGNCTLDTKRRQLSSFFTWLVDEEYIIRELGKRAEIGKCHPHKFRATTATRAIDHGMPIEQVKEMLGHSQIDTTLIYAQVSQRNVKISHDKYLC